MTLCIEKTPRGLRCTFGAEILAIEAWAGGVRVRATLAEDFRDETLSALLASEAAPDGIEIGDDRASLRVGALHCELAIVRSHGEPAEDLQLRFVDARHGDELLAERRAHFGGPGPRAYAPIAHRSWRIENTFRAQPGERIFGMGQRQHGLLDQKGCVLELLQRNGEVNIPFALSSRGYGFLWNTPATGRVEFGNSLTRWVADAGWQVDYWVAAGTPREILLAYADATGHAPPFPAWATGFWQSRLRYASQNEVIAIAREFVRRGLPLTCLVIDFFHWTRQGEWRFDPRAWPDPAAMVAELRSHGIETVVSVWPTVNPNATTFAEMRDRGWLVETRRGSPYLRNFVDTDTGPEHTVPMAFYDATHPEAAAAVFEHVRLGYHVHGIKGYWLDACEPEAMPLHPEDLRLHRGTGTEVLNAYPAMHARAFHDGFRTRGESEAVLLCRSAWAGSQRYGCLLWSGDIASTFESLRAQVRAGLNAGLSGIGWWTTDVGGFYDGDGESAEFRELLIRWFQWGVFCPVLRLHGFRKRAVGDSLGSDTAAAHAARPIHELAFAGGDNEPWSFGAQVLAILERWLQVRERLRPYVAEQFDFYARTGVPLMRPLFLEYPDDRHAWQVDDQYFFGPRLLVAPVLEYGARRRDVYLPVGETWIDACTGESHAGGRIVACDAPLDRIPVFTPASRPLSIE